jgi:hypothetical protein
VNSMGSGRPWRGRPNPPPLNSFGQVAIRTIDGRTVYLGTESANRIENWREKNAPQPKKPVPQKTDPAKHKHDTSVKKKQKRRSKAQPSPKTPQPDPFHQFVYNQRRRSMPGKPMTVALSEAAWKGILSNFILGDRSTSRAWVEWQERVRQHILKCLLARTADRSINVTLGKNNWVAIMKVVSECCKSKGYEWIDWQKRIEHHIMSSEA